MNARKEKIKEPILASFASKQWQKIKICDHHGIVIPLFSLHSQSSCGIGEYPDLIPIIKWCEEVGLDLIQLLPLNDTGLETSPYSALSAFAFNPLHIGLTQLPFWKDNPDLKNTIHELQHLTKQTQRVDYKTIYPKREEFLRNYYDQYGSLFTSQKEYQTFKAKQAFWLNDYAFFKTLKIVQNWKSWEEWPCEFKNPSFTFFQQLPAKLQIEAEYQKFVQFLCFQQIEEVKQQAEKHHVYIKGDIPILVNRESVDVWRYSNLFLMDFSAGAPPDMYSKEGQKWGFPLYNWETMASEHYQWWIERLLTASQFYDIYRIDHIVGFFRIWAIPLDLLPKLGYFIPVDEGKWISQGTDVMHVMLANSQMLPIGEDLGVIPPQVRECLQSLGICGTKVIRWERYWHGDLSYINPKDYSPISMTTVSTHDSETLQMWWKNNPEEAMLYAQSIGMEYSKELNRAQHLTILQESHRSGSLFHVNLLQEYLALIPQMTWPNLEDDRINIPGTISENNWSYRFFPSVEEITENIELKGIMQELTKN